MRKTVFLCLAFIVVISLLAGCQSAGAGRARTGAAGPAKIPADMVFIKGGTFVMGSPETEFGRGENETPHEVTLSSFCLGKTPVTVGQFRAFVEAAGYQTAAERGLPMPPVIMEPMPGGLVWENNVFAPKPDAIWSNPWFEQGDDQPVVIVSWFDAVEYCNWRSLSEGLSPAYTINGTEVTWNREADGYRLPTEAEWEYACRAGTTTPFSTGDNITTDQAAYDGGIPYHNNPPGVKSAKTAPVASFPPNAWGLYDMHGNVWEWCWDWYGPYPTEPQTDPAGPAAAEPGKGRIIRGASWGSRAQYARSAQRIDYSVPDARHNNMGFRIARG